MDTIYRTAAIDALDSIGSLDTDADREYARKVFEALPSAQSEPCEYYALCRHGRDENKLRADLGVCDYCYEDSDGYVKPIEKNCHAYVNRGFMGWHIVLKARGWIGEAKINFCPMCGRELNR